MSGTAGYHRAERRKIQGWVATGENMISCVVRWAQKGRDDVDPL
jgi:hypothetical protein